MPICEDPRRPKQAVINSDQGSPDPDIIIRSNFDSDDLVDNGVRQPCHAFCDIILILAIFLVRTMFE